MKQYTHVLAFTRYTPSQADVHVFKALSAAPSATEAPNVARWYKHIQSYTAEFGGLPGTSTAGEVFFGAAAAPAKADEEDEEVDLFGESDEEEEDADTKAKKQQILDEYNKKKAAKPKAAAKVRFITRSSAQATSTDDPMLVCCDLGSQALGRHDGHGCDD